MTSAYLDLQVNGCYGVDFNGDDLTAESLHEVCRRLKEDGAEGILVTVITDDLSRMERRLANIARLRAADPLAKEIIHGVHIEGPFISREPGYVGAHPVEFARPADSDAMQRLLDAADGLTRIVTLAPEQDLNQAVIRLLSSQNIRVSAGHCDPSLDQLDAAIDAGLSMFTHLGNGCPLSLHRHDNIIQRVLSRADRLWISLIADGVHIPWFVLGNCLRAIPPERAIVVTDAISAAGLGPGRYMLGDQDVVVDEAGATWSADRSHLVGSASTMPQMIAGLQTSLGLSPEKVEQLTLHNPRRVLGEEPRMDANKRE
jgi:N-acetylglucosamine-6-phosphate deacetylase